MTRICEGHRIRAGDLVGNFVKSNKIYIYDTTLRDGAQAEGISFTVNDKLRIARKLDFLGVDYIEAGIQALTQGYGIFHRVGKTSKSCETIGLW